MHRPDITAPVDGVKHQLTYLPYSGHETVTVDCASQNLRNVTRTNHLSTEYEKGRIMSIRFH